jgi:hypothetical protein
LNFGPAFRYPVPPSPTPDTVDDEKSEARTHTCTGMWNRIHIADEIEGIGVTHESAWARN